MWEVIRGMVYTRGTARIRHSESGVIYEIPADEVDFVTLSSEERQMGPEISYIAQVEHPELGSINWMLWEYPIGAENDRETDVGLHELLENINFGLSAEPPEEDEVDYRVDLLVDWFFSHFEDPAHETPYNGREGGYQYIHGGPYDAREELENQFPEELDQVIELAVSKIEADGIINWAPKRVENEVEELWGELDVVPETIGEIKTDDLLAEYSSSSLSVHFEFDSDGIIKFAYPKTAPAPPHNDPIFAALLENTEQLGEVLNGTNSHVELERVLARYRSSLDAEQFSIRQMYDRGVNLQNAAASIREQIAADALPPLPDESSVLLSTILELHSAILQDHPEGVTLLEDAQTFQLKVDEQALLKSVADIISAEMEKQKELFSEEVLEVVEYELSKIGQGPHPQQSNQVAFTTIISLGTCLVAEVILQSAVGGAFVAGGAEVVNTIVATSAASAETIGATVSTGVEAIGSIVQASIKPLHSLAAAISTDTGWISQFWNVSRQLIQLSESDCDE